MDDRQYGENDSKPDSTANVPDFDSAGGAYEAPGRVPAPRQSGIGIASFVLALVCIVFIVIASIMVASSIQDYVDLAGNPISQEEIQEQAMNDGGLIGGVLLFMGALGIGFVGLILGIIALALKGRRKVFAIIGTVLSGLVIAGFVGLIVIGIAMQGSLPA